MKFEYYKNEISALDKAHFNEVEEWLGRAVLDGEITVYELADLNDIADKIYYGQTTV